MLPPGENLKLSKMKKPHGPANNDSPPPPPQEVEVGTGVEDNQRGRRDLQFSRSNSIKQRRVLAVRVRASDAETTPSAGVLSDKVFGTYGDTSNLRERFATCSYGETQMIPFNGRTRTGVSISNGVYSVTINRRVRGVDEGIIRDAVTEVLSRELGDLPSQFDHVMLCLPPQTSGDWIGYGMYPLSCRLFTVG